MATMVMPGMPVTLLNAVVAVGTAPADATGAAVAAMPQYQGGGVPRKFAWDVIIAGGVLTALVADLLGSDDGTNWTVIDTYNSTTSTHRDVVDKTYRFVSARVTTYTVSSGTPTVTAKLYI